MLGGCGCRIKATELLVAVVKEAAFLFLCVFFCMIGAILLGIVDSDTFLSLLTFAGVYSQD